SFLIQMVRSPPRPTLFPYTPLFRSRPQAVARDSVLGKNAEGEIRTPEGLAAHQISSLARWTGLRYLSARAITETRKIPSLVSWGDRKSTRLNSSHEWISYAVFCLKK